MADAVTSTDVFSGGEYLVRRFTNISDGTGESAVVKVDKSTLVDSQTKVAPTKLALCELWWSIYGFLNVRLFWNQTAAEVMALMSAGNGVRLLNLQPTPSGILLPQTAPGAGNGNVLLTTSGAISGATYDIMAKFKLIQ